MRSLEVTNLSCSYGTTSVLKNVSFSLEPGEVLAVIGPSGSGKTTLTYCVSGIIPNIIPAAVSGSIKIDGEEMLGKGVEEVTRHVGFVLQNYELQIFGLTVEDDIELSSEGCGDERVRHIMAAFRLDAYAKYFVHELSGGLKRRLVIASALLKDVDYLVVDDPVANLDWSGKKTLAETIRMLRSKGKGVLLLGKRMKGLEEVIDRVVELPGRKDTSNTHSVITGFPPERTKVTSNGPAASFESVWFRYSKDFVLRDVNLEVRRGEVVSVMGPNGSGKTTMMKLMNGLLKPTKGKVTVSGIDTRSSNPSELARHVGTVFQESEKYIVFESVWDEVAFGPKNLGIGDGYVEKALEMLGLDGKRCGNTFSLSVGEKMRLSIASAIAMDPEIILMDEPTTGQDEETLSQLASIIRGLKSYGKTVMIVTHDTDFAFQTSDRVVILKDGGIVYEGEPSPLLNDLEMLIEWGLEPPSRLGDTVCLQSSA
ncbi:MAG: ATP-binding cassette domain-containing protein [Nitrososphaerota archaeon]